MGQKSWKFQSVGKTSCSIELATALAKYYGRRTLLVELDPQASSTFFVMEQEHWKLWKKIATELHVSYTGKIKKDELINKILAKQTHSHSEQYAIQHL